MLSLGDKETIARNQFVNFITRKLIDASTFVADDRRFIEFESSRVRREIERAKEVAEKSGDMQSIADAYARENEILRGQLEDQQKEIENLRQSVEQLSIALQSSSSASASAELDAPPATVADAIKIAKSTLSGSLIIASESEKEWLELNPSAGPPEKILRYLQTLARMSDILSEEGASLGMSIPIWLRKQNVECSVDSKTGKEAKAEKIFRKRQIEGQIFDCEFHAKPSDGTSPDMCVRIYFCITESKPKVRVGYIGRHPD